MEKEKYIESVKDELEKLLKLDSNDYYEKCLTRQEVKLYVSTLCENLADFDGDKWQLAEIVAATVFELCRPDLPGAGLVAYLALKIFKNGAKSVCEKLKS